MKSVWEHRLRPVGQTTGEGPDLALGGVRGLCACAVFYAHLFLPLRMLDPLWAPPPQFMWLNLGYPAVLMFFVLSGYVIGLVTPVPATVSGVRSYLIRRFARLCPLVAIAVALSWLLGPHTGGRAVLGNLLFLQNDLPYPVLGSFPLLVNNPNLWSLNYEALYYLAFLPVWIWAPRTVLVFAGLALPICAHAAGFPVPQILARYACGALFWFAGLAVSWSGRTPPAMQRGNWPAALLAAYAMWMLAPLRGILLEWGLYRWTWLFPVSPHRLDFLPACVWVLLAVTGRAPRAQRLLAWVCLTLVAGGLTRNLASGEGGAANIIAGAAVCVAAVLARRDFSVRALQHLAPLGAVSFGLYVLAAPIQLGQRAMSPDFSGSSLTFAIRLAFTVALVSGAVWLLERRVCLPIETAVRRWGGASASRQAHP